MHRIKRFIPLIVLAGLIALIFAMGWNRYLSLDTIRDHGQALRDFTADNYALALAALILAFALSTASVVPGVVFLTITAGYLFGPWVGGVATAFGATVGALGIYWVGRSAMGEALRKKAAKDTGLLKKVCDGIDDNTFWYVLVARLVVSVPFHMINLAAGVMSVRLKPYLAATFLGLLPAHTIYCWIGSGLNEILAENPDPNIQALFGQFMWPLLGVAFLSMALPLIIKLIRGRAEAAT